MTLCVRFKKYMTIEIILNKGEAQMPTGCEVEKILKNTETYFNDILLPTKLASE